MPPTGDPRWTDLSSALCFREATEESGCAAMTQITCGALQRGQWQLAAAHQTRSETRRPLQVLSSWACRPRGIAHTCIPHVLRHAHCHYDTPRGSEYTVQPFSLPLVSSESARALKRARLPIYLHKSTQRLQQQIGTVLRSLTFSLAPWFDPEYLSRSPCSARASFDLNLYQGHPFPGARLSNTLTAKNTRPGSRAGAGTR